MVNSGALLGRRRKSRNMLKHSSSTGASTFLDHYPFSFLQFVIKESETFRQKHPEGGLLKFLIVDKRPKSEKANDTFYYKLAKKESAERRTLEVIVPTSRSKADQVACYALCNECLGEGANGKVVKAIDLNTMKLMACKISEHYGVDDDFADIARERDNLAIMNRFAAAFTRTLLGDDGVQTYEEWTIMDFSPGESLQDHLYTSQQPLQKNTDLSRMHLMNLCLAVIDEVLCAHKLGLILRDIKIDNFRFQQSKHPHLFKLAFVDYGSALPVKLAEQTKTLIGTSPGYVAPELTVQNIDQRKTFSFKTDYYSLGVLLGEIISDESYQEHLETKLSTMQASSVAVQPLRHKEIKRGLSDVFKTEALKKPTVHEGETKLQQDAANLWRLFIVFIRKLTAEDPKKRISPDNLHGEYSSLRLAFTKYYLDRQNEGRGERRKKTLIHTMLAKKGLSVPVTESRSDTFYRDLTPSMVEQYYNEDAEDNASKVNLTNVTESAHSSGDGIEEISILARAQDVRDSENDAVSEITHQIDALSIEKVEQAIPGQAKIDSSLLAKIKALTDLLESVKGADELPDAKARIQHQIILSNLNASKNGLLNQEVMADLQTLIAAHPQSFAQAELALAEVRRLSKP